MMNDLFGISFSNSAMIVAHSSGEPNDLPVSLDAIPYPFLFDFNTFFDDERLDRLSESLSKLILDKNIENPEIRVSLPANFAYIKKVAVPLDENPEILYSQADWEFQNFLPEEIANYKIIKLEKEYVFGGYKELVFICIRHSIIKKLGEFAKKSGGRLRKVLLDSHSIEFFMKKKNLSDPEKNQIVFKVDKYTMETHLYIKGNYYMSYLNNIKNPEDPEEKKRIIEIAKEKYDKTKVIIEQLPFVDNTSFQIYLSGAALDENSHRLFLETFSEPIETLYSEKITGFAAVTEQTVEALGVVYE